VSCITTKCGTCVAIVVVWLVRGMWHVDNCHGWIVLAEILLEAPNVERKVQRIGTLLISPTLDVYPATTRRISEVGQCSIQAVAHKRKEAEIV
jgi:hypothetical protein